MFRFNDRALIIGATGSGKSELINVLLAGVRCQRLVIDSKHEFELPEVEPAYSVGAIDWRQRTILFRPAPDAARKVWDDVFRAAYSRPNALVVAVHELGDVCDFQPSSTPTWFNAYLSKGRSRSKGLLAGTQRPVQIPKRALTESDHVYMVGERLMWAPDHDAVAQAMGRNPRELAQLIDRVQEQLGGEPDPQGRTHAYIGFTRARREVKAYPPLPAGHRARIDVGRSFAIDGGAGGAAEVQL